MDWDMKKAWWLAAEGDDDTGGDNPDPDPDDPPKSW